MTDITMCNGEDCPMKGTCHRHTARPASEWQSWFVTTPIDKEGNCDYYWREETTG